MTLDFFAPKPNALIIGLTHRLGAFLARHLYQLRLQVSPDVTDTLLPLRQKRVIYMVNHPTFNDPIPVMLLSARLRKGFYYLASIEQFSGILGWYFQRIGTYSVRRGQSDRPSIQQTLALLARLDTHLVIFPEGGCSYQNDTVMPFRPGAIQLAFQAMRQDLKRGSSLEDCFVVPLALKYRYEKDPEPAIQSMLAALEAALSLSMPTTASNYDRLRAIAAQVLRQIEAEYGFAADDKGENLTPRIEALRQHILAQCESALGIEANVQAPARERTYQIEAKIMDESCVPTQLSRDLIQRSVFRLFNFNAIYDGYVAETFSPERFIDTLTRLQREVFQMDRPQKIGPWVAQIAVGTPLNLKDEYDNYKCDRAKTIDRLTGQVQAQVQMQVDQLSAR